MKPPPAPNVPGDTLAERLSNALNRVLRVSKADLLKEEARLRRASEKRKRGQKETRFLTPPNLPRLLYLRVLAAICSNRWIMTFVLRI